MKKFYTLSLSALVLVASASAAPNRFVKKQIVKNPKHVAVVKKSDAAKLWRPATSTESIYEDGEWIVISESVYEYDSKGNCVKESFVEDGFVTVVSKKYNDDNMLVERLNKSGEEGATLENESKMTYVYDTVVKDYYIERRGYDWADGEWFGNYYSENNKITRNADGNITEIVKELPLSGNMAPAYRSVWGYDAASGQADSFVYYMNVGEGVTMWEVYENVSYRNITWQNTDGQMTKEIEALTIGANRVKSADVYYEDEIDGHIFVSYSGEKDFVLKNTLINPDDVAQEVRYEVIDQNGSYKITTLTYLDDDYNLTTEPFVIETETVTVDSYGNETESKIESVYGDEPPFVSAQKAEYVYDANGNAMEVTTYFYDEELEDFVPESKVVYGEYVDVAGVGDIAVGGGVNVLLAGRTLKVTGASEVSVYNMQGAKLAGAKGCGEVSVDLSGLATGVYVVSAANMTNKIVLK